MPNEHLPILLRFSHVVQPAVFYSDRNSNGKVSLLVQQLYPRYPLSHSVTQPLEANIDRTSNSIFRTKLIFDMAYKKNISQ